ncbi:MAG: radical SAM protein [Bacteroidales bacterium]|jgi:radical SAM superfamily enzyme YgiQ (UPF0313 family)|nr:radical SAM protein [Bacteroidales bacterium]
MDFIMNDKDVRVLLINPPIITPMATPSEKGPFSDIGENLGLGILSSSLNRYNIPNDIIDFCLENKTLAEMYTIIEKGKYKIVGISMPSIAAFSKAIEIATYINGCFPAIHITCGGHYATIDYKRILLYKCFNSTILEDGEDTIVELAIRIHENWHNILGIAYSINDKIIRNELRLYNEIMDSIPFPNRSKLPYVLAQGGFAALSTSRGCYGHCAFCSSASYANTFGSHTWRYRSAQNVIDEIKLLYNNYGVSDFIVIDDCFIGRQEIGKQRAIDIAQSIIQMNIDVRYLIMCKPEEVNEVIFTQLYKSGLMAVSVGIESGNQDVLNRLNRKTTIADCKYAISVLKRIGIQLFIGLIPFDPYSKFSEINDTIQFLYDLGELNISFFRKRMMIMPNSFFYKQLIKCNNLDQKGNYLIFNEDVEMLACVLESSSKEYGSLLNNLLYVIKWQICIERSEEMLSLLKIKIQKINQIVNFESYNILHDVIMSIKIENCDTNELIIATEEKIRKLYFNILNIYKNEY